MAAEWYVDDGDRATGPFSVSQMKAQAAAARIKPDTQVRKGKWVAAKTGQRITPSGSDSNRHVRRTMKAAAPKTKSRHK